MLTFGMCWFRVMETRAAPRPAVRQSKEAGKAESSNPGASCGLGEITCSVRCSGFRIMQPPWAMAATATRARKTNRVSLIDMICLLVKGKWGLSV